MTSSSLANVPLLPLSMVIRNLTLDELISFSLISQRTKIITRYFNFKIHSLSLDLGPDPRIQLLSSDDDMFADPLFSFRISKFTGFNEYVGGSKRTANRVSLPIKTQINTRCPGKTLCESEQMELLEQLAEHFLYIFSVKNVCVNSKKKIDKDCFAFKYIKKEETNK